MKEIQHYKPGKELVFLKKDLDAYLERVQCRNIENELEIVMQKMGTGRLALTHRNINSTRRFDLLPLWASRKYKLKLKKIPMTFRPVVTESKF